MASDSIDVDYIENSAHAVRDGVLCFLKARTEPWQLVNAIPHLFRTVELLLKAKLATLDGRALADHPNNRKVIDRLAARGVVLSTAERDCIDRLRQLRNRLQHGTAKFNYRTGLSVARQSIVFIDRFALQEVDAWIVYAIAPDDRLALFQIRDVGDTARRLVAERLNQLRNTPAAEVTHCPACDQQAMVRVHRRSGAACYYCGHTPPLPSDWVDM
jgi:hypothetical protein